MAFTPVGFDGSVTEGQWAAIQSHAGVGAGVVVGANDLLPTIVSGVDRTVSIAAGVCHAAGVMGTLSPAQTVQHATVASGSRWDTIVARRDWTANTIALVIVQGTSTQAVAAGVLNNPGGSHDQLIALVQITAGQQLPTGLIDLRAHAGKVLNVKDLLAISTAPIGTEAVVGVGGARYRRELVSGSVATVKANDSGWIVSTPATYTGYVGYRRRDGIVTVQIELDSSTASSSTPVSPIFLILPDTGFRPSRVAHNVAVVNGSRFHRMRVHPNGNVEITGMTIAPGESINGSVTYPWG